MWRKSGNASPLTLAACFLATFLLNGCEKARLDEEVRALCAKDGGIKVYEAITVQPEEFNSYGRLTFWHPSNGEDSLGPQYIYREEEMYYRYGNPEMWRTHHEIWRKADGKKLSEATIYTRRGGDFPGPWHDSSFSCPEPKDSGLIEKTFILSLQN